MSVVSNLKQLRSIYNYSKGRAAVKVISSLEKHSKNFINLSPFVVISSKGKNGHADVSPRGDSVGFIKIQDDKTIINPKRIQYFGEHKPASTLLEISALVDPRMKVEIEAEAVIIK